MLVALTGGIGCGKSVALSFFAELGWLIVDADRICHELYDDKLPAIVEPMRDRWGASLIILPDGSIDKKKVAKIVFKNDDELEWLNSLFHPLIWKKAEPVLANSENKRVMFDVPLLFEAGWEDRFERVISIWTDRKEQVRRLKQKGLTLEGIRLRMKNQMLPDAKLERADFGLINNGSQESLYMQCRLLNKQIKE